MTIVATPRVVHCLREPFDIYIGRRMERLVWTYTAPWGNPFYWPRQRERSIQAYEEWLQQQPQLLARLPELRGKTLGCWCVPKACHGDVLLRLANPPREPAESSDLTQLMHALLEIDQS